MSVFFLIYFSLPYQLGYFSPVISTPPPFFLEYGSKAKHELTIVTGVAQEMASISKGI